jgi:hypothetical protein
VAKFSMDLSHLLLNFLLILSHRNFSFLLKLTSNISKKHPLGVVNEAIVACLQLADLALIQRAVSHILALVALLLNVAVRFLEDQLVLRKVIDRLAVELFGAVFIQALLLVDEGLAF